MTLRIAIIGAGAFAHEHAESILAQPAAARLVAAVDPNVERAGTFCAQHGIPAAYTDTADLLRTEQPDIVAICSPPHTHAPLITQALHAGAHVVCEKPLALSLEQLDDIIEVEQTSGRTCTTIFQWRYGSAARYVKHLIESGEAGVPLLALCNTLWYRSAEYYSSAPWRSSWASAGGGVAMTLGIHALDMTLWLMGDWQEVSALTSSLDRTVEVDTLALAQVRFVSGALGAFANSALSPRQESYVRFDLQRLTIELKHLYEYGSEDWRFTPLDGLDAPYDAASEGTARGSIATQWAHMLRAFAEGQSPDTGVREVRPTYDFLASLYKAAASGQSVQRGTIVRGDPFYHGMKTL
jgi:predicted dehydrogenase